MKYIYNIKYFDSIRIQKFIPLLLALLIIIVINISSCKKFLDIPPPKDAVTPTQIFENDAIATSAITGIYSRMASNGTFSGDNESIAVLTGLTGDELKSYYASLDYFYNNEIPTTSVELNNLWSNSYTYIYTSNAILAGLATKNGVTEATNKELQGEAKFIRAFCYFYLVNLFGDVPLNLSTDYRVNEIAKKATKEIIYAQIITDLSDAVNLLPTTYITTERIRPNKWAAKALLARVYLYVQQWDLAIQNSTEIINQKTTYALLNDLDKVFLKNSTEAIWQLMPMSGGNTQEGNLFIPTATPLFASLSSNFAKSFELADNRKSKWIKDYVDATGTYYYPSKYKVSYTTTVTEYSMVIRLAEIYLIRAEARAKLGQIDAALEDINVIRKRASLSSIEPGLTQIQCLNEVESQRKFELFTEWGHRWLDLKRTNRLTEVILPIKGSVWQPSDVLYPIPFNEINRNPNSSQNPGY
jgi:hypothetical protein